MSTSVIIGFDEMGEADETLAILLYMSISAEDEKKLPAALAGNNSCSYVVCTGEREVE